MRKIGRRLAALLLTAALTASLLPVSAAAAWTGDFLDDDIMAVPEEGLDDGIMAVPEEAPEAERTVIPEETAVTEAEEDATVTAELEDGEAQETWLDIPVLVQVTNSVSGVTLVWSPVDGATWYQVLRKTGEGDWKNLGCTDGSLYLDIDLDLYTQYTYTVRCVNQEEEPISDYDPEGISLYYPSGSCGSAVSWRLDPGGQLVISGTGPMEDSYNIELTPWFFLRNRITSARVEEGVTSLGGYAFHACEQLTEVTLADTVQSIGPCAFFCCTSLQQVNIPVGVTSLDYRTFYGCGQLTQVELPDTLTAIGAEAFNNCAALSQLELPAGVTSIGAAAFSGCKALASIDLPQGITALEQNTFLGCASLTQLTIPQSVTSIGPAAFFSCTGLESLTIPAGVSQLGTLAFAGCTSLETVRFEGPVPEPREDWFGSTACTVYMPEDYLADWWAADLEKLGADVVWICLVDGKAVIPAPVLETAKNWGGGIQVTWAPVRGASGYRLYRKPASGSTWTAVGDVTGTSCLDTGVTAGETYDYTVCCLDGTGQEMSACAADSLQIRCISTGVYGDELTWSYQDGVLTISGQGAMYDFDTDHSQGWLSYSGEIHTVILEEGVTSVGRKAFADCKSLTKVELGSTVTVIGESAFSGCTALTNLVIPATVREIGANALNACTGTVYFRGNAPETAQNVFGTASCTAYYPYGVSAGWTAACRQKLGAKVIWKGWTPSTGATYACATPVLVQAVNTANGVQLTWEPVEGADEYRVFRKENGTGSWKALTDTTDTKYLDTEATGGVAYTYTVRCINRQKTAYTSYYDTDGKTLVRLAQPAITTKNGPAGVWVMWNKSAGADGYYVYRKTATSGWKQIGAVKGADTLKYADVSIKDTSGTTYIYTVRAYSGTTLSSYSAGSIICFLQQPTVTTKNGPAGVWVMWNKSAGADGYYVYRKTAASGWKQIAAVKGADTLKYADVSVKDTSGTTYIYTVRAYSGTTLSSYSAGSTICFLQQPTLTVSNTTGGVQVNWDQIGGAAGYRVFRKTADSGWQVVATIPNGKTVSYVDTTVKDEKGVQYLYTVRAYCGSAWSSYHAGKAIVR